MKNRKKIISTILVIFLTIIIITSSSLAYFDISRNYGGNTASIVSKNLSIKFSDGPDISLDKTLPGEAIIKTFSVENTGSDTVDYSIIISDVINELTRKSDLVYTLTSTNNGAIVTETTFPDSNGILAQYISIPKDTIQNYTLTITYKNMNEDQSIDMNKSVHAVIKLEDGKESYNITGYAYDSNGNLMTSGFVEVHSDIISAPINSDGSFILENIPLGNHEIFVKDNLDMIIANGTFKLESTNSEYEINDNIINVNRNIKTLSLLIYADDSDNISFEIPGELRTVNLIVNNGYASNFVLTAYDGKKTNEVILIPEDNYIYDHVVCTDNISYTYLNGVIYIDSLSSNGTCTIYNILDGVNLYDMMVSNASNANINFAVRSGVSNTNGIYITNNTESGNPVYYYRGNVNNNIIFNDMCWKILRTTETGGIKLIYNGVVSGGKCNGTGTTAQIGTSKFNNSNNDNIYVGYMYGTTGSSTYEQTHANLNNSTVKTYIDNWYQNNFKNINITSKLEDTVFCNDRSVISGGENNVMSSSISGGGYGTMETIYGTIDRAGYFTINPSPTLVCPNDNDKFTVSSSNGNGMLTYPVGLITLDEVVFAGFNTYGSNNSNYRDYSNYLNSGAYYWSMSPVYYNTSANVGYVNGDNYANISGNTVTTVSGVRPVISLKAGVIVTNGGNGSTTNPYVVK